MENYDVPIIIPAYEPDDQLPQLCDDLCEAGLRNIIIVDDGSGTKYRKLFNQLEEKYHCTVIRHAVNLGKGRALKNAFNMLLNQENTQIIGCVTADSDGQHTPEDIKKCICALREHPDALILGCRNFDSDDVPWKSRFGNELTRKVFSFLCGIKVSDTQTGLRGIPTEFMKKLLPIDGERFEYETNMLIACKNAVEIVEVPIATLYDSKENHATHFNPIKDSIKIYKIFGGMFLKYIFSSLSSCAIDLILFSVFCSVFKPYIGGFYVAVATVAARVISALYNYAINYKMVFQSSENHSNSFTKYVLLAVIQMLLSAALVTTGVGVFAAVPEIIVKVIVDTVLFFLSYYIQKKYVF